MDLTKKQIRDTLKLDTEDLHTLATEILDELANRLEDLEEGSAEKEEE
jgi:hypothetical protein